MQFYETRKPINVLGLLKSPYGIMAVLALFVIFVFPMFKVDPQEYKEFMGDVRLRRQRLKQHSTALTAKQRNTVQTWSLEFRSPAMMSAAMTRRCSPCEWCRRRLLPQLRPPLASVHVVGTRRSPPSMLLPLSPGYPARSSDRGKEGGEAFGGTGAVVASTRVRPRTTRPRPGRHASSVTRPSRLSVAITRPYLEPPAGTRSCRGRLSRAGRLARSLAQNAEEKFFTDWEETFDSFDQMNLHENLLRGIYAYGEGFSGSRVGSGCGCLVSSESKTGSRKTAAEGGCRLPCSRRQLVPVHATAAHASAARDCAPPCGAQQALPLCQGARRATCGSEAWQRRQGGGVMEEKGEASH
eukprot:356968-Chlamydomonas_euryale.AAC.10